MILSGTFVPEVDRVCPHCHETVPWQPAGGWSTVFSLAEALFGAVTTFEQYIIVADPASGTCSLQLPGYAEVTTEPTAHAMASKVIFLAAAQKLAAERNEADLPPVGNEPGHPECESRVLGLPCALSCSAADRQRLASRMHRERVLALHLLGQPLPDPEGADRLMTLAEIAYRCGVKRGSLTSEFVNDLGKPDVPHRGQLPALFRWSTAAPIVERYYPAERRKRRGQL